MQLSLTDEDLSSNGQGLAYRPSTALGLPSALRPPGLLRPHGLQGCSTSERLCLFQPQLAQVPRAELG